MKNYKKLIIVTVLVSILSTCKKDNYEPKVSDVPCLLTKITRTVNEDLSNHTYTFEYDKYRRLVKINEDSLPNWNIQYDKQGRIDLATNFFIGEEYWRKKYTWGDKSLTVITSQKRDNGEWLQDGKKTYEFNDNNRLIKQQNYFHGNGEWTVTDYIIYTWENGNITKDDWYFYTGEKQVTHFYEYDNKNNFYASYGYLKIENINTITKNNMIKYGHEYNDSIIWSVNSSEYEYNSRDYPSRLTEAVETEYGSYIIDWHFEYECNE